MSRWSKDRRVLEPESTNYARYRLIDLEEPELRRDIFPYSDVCRTVFDHQITTIDPAKNFFITDTTFRDGQQARPPYTVQQIVDIYSLLHRMSGPRGVIRQSEFFLYSKKDREAVDACRALGHEFPEITGWIRAVPEDLKLVKEMGADRDRHSDFGFGLPHLFEAGSEPDPGPGQVPGHRQGGHGTGNYTALSL